jgi:predicted aspartyl protease
LAQRPSVMSHLIQFLSAGITAIAGMASPLALAQDAADASLIPLPSGHYALEVNVNGDGPFLFTLDTGASHSALVQPLAELYGFQSTLEDLSPIQTLTQAISTERFTVETLGFGGIEARTVETVVLQGPPAIGLSALGIVGTNALEGRRIRIDYGAQRLWVAAPPPIYHDGQVDAAFNVLVGEARVMGVPVPVRVLIDTGSARTIVNSRLARWTERYLAARQIQIGGANGSSELVDTEGLAELNEVQVGGLCTAKLMALEADVDVFRAFGWDNQPAMILGMDALENAVLTIDYDQDRFELSPAAGVARCADGRVQHPSAS